MSAASPPEARRPECAEDHLDRLLARRKRVARPAPVESYRMIAYLLAERDDLLREGHMGAYHTYSAAVALAWIAVHNFEAGHEPDVRPDPAGG